MWFDWNADGILNNTTEYTLFALASAVNGVATQYSFPVPLDVARGANIFTRFRLSTAGITTPSGAAADGEVEDYVYKSPLGAQSWAPSRPRALSTR